MTISPKAIERYLARPVPYLPQFKHAERDVLERSIYNSTGAVFSAKTQPRPYQLEGIAFALYARRALLFFDMRTGKTLMALQWAEHLRRARLWTNKGLVIAHSPLGLDVWRAEAAKHSNLKIRVVHLDPDDFCNALESDCDLIVIPWSGIQGMFSEKGVNRKGQNKLYPARDLIEIAAGDFGLCIIDEVHICMHHTSLRFQIGAALTSNCKFRLCLTGTPFGRDPYALWSQAFLADRGETLGHNYYFFEQAFGTGKKNYFSGRIEFKFDKSKLSILEDKMSAISMTYKRDEIADQTVWSNVVSLSMAGDQRAAYYDVIKKLINLDAKERVEILNTFHRLRQVSSGYLPFEDQSEVKRTVHFRENVKLEWLDEFVQAAPEDVQIVIFHEYTHSGELICEMLKKRKATFGWLYGGVASINAARSIVKHFQTGRTQYLVANSAKGGMSIDLPTCDYMIFYESPVSPIIRSQAEARPMARGNRPLMIDDLTCSPVEARILEYIGEGKDLMASLAGARRRFAA